MQARYAQWQFYRSLYPENNCIDSVNNYIAFYLQNNRTADCLNQTILRYYAVLIDSQSTIYMTADNLEK